MGCFLNGLLQHSQGRWKVKQCEEKFTIIYEFYVFTIIEEIAIGNIRQDRKMLIKTSVNVGLPSLRTGLGEKKREMKSIHVPKSKSECKFRCFVFHLYKLLRKFKDCKSV